MVTQRTFWGFLVKFVLHKDLTRKTEDSIILESESILLCLGDSTYCHVYEVTDSLTR